VPGEADAEHVEDFPLHPVGPLPQRHDAPATSGSGSLGVRPWTYTRSPVIVLMRGVHHGRTGRPALRVVQVVDGRRGVAQHVETRTRPFRHLSSGEGGGRRRYRPAARRAGCPGTLSVAGRRRRTFAVRVSRYGNQFSDTRYLVPVLKSPGATNQLLRVQLPGRSGAGPS